MKIPYGIKFYFFYLRPISYFGTTETEQLAIYLKEIRNKREEINKCVVIVHLTQN